MDVVIAGIQVSILKEHHLPLQFREALRGFTVTRAKECPVFCVEVLRGQSKEGECRVFSRQIRIDRGKRGDIFSLRVNPKCALADEGERKPWKLYIFEDSDLRDSDLSEQVTLLIRIVFEYYAAFLGKMSLHASALVDTGECICITGASGTGKSTLTRNYLAAQPDSYVLNGDRPVVGVLNHKAYAYGAPWSGKEHIFVAGQAPIRAIVEVRKHCKNRIAALTPGKAYKMLLQRISTINWDSSAATCVMNTLEDIVRNVRVYRCYCLNDKSAGEFLHQSLHGTADSKRAIKEVIDLKISSEYVIRNVLGDYIAVPVGDVGDGHQDAIVLNELGAFIWNILKEANIYDVVLDRILAEYDIDRQTAKQDLDEFLEMIRAAGLLDEE